MILGTCWKRSTFLAACCQLGLPCFDWYRSSSHSMKELFWMDVGAMDSSRCAQLLQRMSAILQSKMWALYEVLTIRHHGRSQNFFDGVCQNLTGWAKIIFSQRLINSIIDFNVHCYFNKLFVAIYHCFICSKTMKCKISLLYNCQYCI